MAMEYRRLQFDIIVQILEIPTAGYFDVDLTSEQNKARFAGVTVPSELCALQQRIENTLVRVPTLPDTPTPDETEAFLAAFDQICRDRFESTEIALASDKRWILPTSVKSLATTGRPPFWLDGKDSLAYELGRQALGPAGEIVPGNPELSDPLFYVGAEATTYRFYGLFSLTHV